MASTKSAKNPVETKSSAQPAAVAIPQPTQRLVSLDAYRGFVMFLMMAEVLHLASVAAALPTSRFWAFLAAQQTHVEWVGGVLHDMIQPSFSFIVGVALPFSIASRLARGQSRKTMSLHAFWRAFLLIALGIFLRSIGQSQTNLHVRRHADPDRLGLRVPVPARISLGPRSMAGLRS